MIYGELGREKIEKTVYRRMLNFWLKLEKQEPWKFSNIFLRITKTDLLRHNNAQYPWINKIKNLLDNNGQSFLFNCTDLPDKKTFNSFIKDLYSCWEKQSFLDNVQTNSACKVYKQFKMELNFESYWKILNTREAIPIGRFRCANPKIPTIRNKFYPNESIYCEYCKNNTLADEYHILLVCPVFEFARAEFLPMYFRNEPSQLKMLQLMNTRDANSLKNLSKLCHYIIDNL